ncbi:hypothetical protein V6N12_002964 [Hibiscus sabdariffa]|uniref:Uncharacterized protein n=1 Tax=Hibiscus sabdariffa TaxID=183260 RepID=A0ABR2EAI5_9ROSI
MNQVYGVIDPVKYNTLKNCTVGWSKRFIRAGRLAKELHDAGVRGVTIMSISVDMEVVNRRAWTACHGIPIHAWSSGMFENIASKWGELISVDEKIVNPGSFSRSMFHVLTERFNRIDEVIELVVDSKKFKVRAVEKLAHRKKPDMEGMGLNQIPIAPQLQMSDPDPDPNP